MPNSLVALGVDLTNSLHIHKMNLLELMNFLAVDLSNSLHVDLLNSLEVEFPNVDQNKNFFVAKGVEPF